MSEVAEDAERVAPVAGPTAGQLLRQARETAGLHVATLAVALKVPVRKLEALEEDRLDQLPDAVFVRALASSVCRTLKVDAQPILDKLPQVATPRLVHHGDGINAPFRAPGEGPARNLSSTVPKPVLLVVALLLLGAIAVAVMPLHPGEPATNVAAAAKPAAVAPTPAPAASATVALSPDAQAPAAAPEASGPALGSGTPAMPAASSIAPAVQPAPVASMAAAPPTAVALSPLAAASAPVASASGVVVFRTTGESWVKVTDAKGTTVLQKLMKEGDSAGATGTLPLTITVGSVKATAVEVRGQAFDLGPHAHDNVARFEVK